MKKLIIKYLILSFLTLSFTLLSCSTNVSADGSASSSGKGASVPGASGSSQQVSQMTAYTANTTSRDLITEDKISSVSFSQVLYINLSDKSYSTDGNTYTVITATKKKNGTTTIEGIYAYISDTVVTVNSESYDSALKIILLGSSNASPFAIKGSSSVLGLMLEDLNITSGNYPAIEVKGDITKTYLDISGTNTITDGRSYGTGYSSEEGTDFYSSSFSGTPETDAELTQTWALGSNTKGTVYSKAPLIISGSGSLSITESYKHAIYSKDYIQMLGSTISITSTGRNGVQSVNGFIMQDGSLTISGTGTHTNNESRGIIVEGSEDNPGEGFIVINGGTISITTYSKAISAKWDIDEDALTTETTDDPYPYVKITGGTITVKTLGTPSDESSSTYTFTDSDGVSVSEKTKLSPEGIEAKQDIFITGGTIICSTTDDGINASRDGSSTLNILGGKIYSYSSGNDAIDSNGTLTISGGTIVALTATNPECAFDCDNYTFTITGGTFVGIGTSNYSSPTASACTQSTFVLSGDYFGKGGTTMAVTDSDSNTLFAFTIPSEIYSTSSTSSYVMILSSPSILPSVSCSIKTAVQVSGGTNFYGLYTTLPTVSGGTATVTGASTSTSSYVYTKSSSTNGGAQEGQHPSAGPGGRF